MTRRSPSFALLRGFPKGTESRIIANIRDGLVKAGLSVEMIEGQSRLFRIAVLQGMMKTDALIVHSPLAYAVIHVALARLLNKTVIGLVWDHYPVTLGGKRFDRSLRRRTLDLLENLAIRLCSSLIVPSRDFLAEKRLARARALPFWIPVDPESCGRMSGHRAGETVSKPFRIIFAGQVNATRGLDKAFAELEGQFGQGFELLVASTDPLPEELNGKSNVSHLGFLTPEDLQEEMARCDAGLVSLASDFDGPGLPSKTFEYLAAGLPCLFVGKSLPHYTEALLDSGAGAALPADDVPRVPALPPRDREAVIRAARRFSTHFELDSGRLALHLREVVSNRAKGRTS